MLRVLAVLFSFSLLAQSPVAPPAPLDYVCPMDPDIRLAVPGTCSRCGMPLKLGIPEIAEYPVTLQFRPQPLRAGRRQQLHFLIQDPRTLKPVREFELVHEKLFHLFVVSQDLNYFIHQHPTLERAGGFRFQTTFPKPGLYRLLCDFYPKGGTPQLIAKTVLVPGGERTPLSVASARLSPDLAPKHATNLDVELVTEPARPIAGMKTLMFFRVNPADGLEPYLGAWGHMLAASDDLVDLIHNHPFLADGGPQIQFNMIFPRARTYRIWVQFQRKGVVNTVVFDVPVSVLQ